MKSKTIVLFIALTTASVACEGPPYDEASHGTPLVLPQALVEWPHSVVRPRFSSDATRIAFASGPEGGALDLYAMDLATGVATRLTDSKDNDTRPTWSPDGRRLVFQSDREGSASLWTYEFGTGAINRLTSADFNQAAPDWSPEGDLITYVSDQGGSWDVWVVRPDGTDPRPVTSHEGNEYHPKFSPDGADIVFYPTWSGWTDIYTVNVETQQLTEVLSSEFEDFRPAWSPDGDFIVFASDRSSPTGLWRVAASGGDPIPIWEPGVGVDYPDWAPDGSAVLYLEETHYSHLFQHDLESGARSRITSDDPIAVDRSPTFSQAGHGLAYETSRYGNEGNVVVRDLSSGREARISHGRINDGESSFSASGERLVYARSGGDRASADAFVTDVGTGETAAWTQRGNVAYPSFCGDDSIVFAWAQVAYTAAHELWVKPAEGPARRIGAFDVERSGAACTDDGATVVASLLASGAEDSSPRLVRVDVATGATHVLTRGTSPHLHPKISPDGRTVAFVSATDGGSAAYTVPLAGGEMRQVISPDRNVGSVTWSGPTSLIYSEVTLRRAARLAPNPGVD